MKITYLYFIFCILFASCQQSSNVKNISSDNLAEFSFKLMHKIDSVSDLISHDTLNPALYFDRAAFYMQNEALDLGASDLKRAVQLDSTNSKYWLKLGILYYAMQESRSAKDCWEYCSNLDIDNIECRINLAEIYLAVGELKKGQKRLNEILDTDPKNPTALFLAGNYALMDKDTIKAMKYIQSAINEDQTLFNAYDQMGVLYSSKRDLLALDYFNAALRLQPYRYDIHYKVGMFYQSLQTFDEAVQAYERAIALKKDHKISLHNIAVIEVFRKNYDSAINYFTQAIIADNSYVEAYFGRAYCYELIGDLVKSESDYRTSLMLDAKYMPSRKGMDRIKELQ